MVRSAVSAILALLVVVAAVGAVEASEPASAPARLEQVYLQLDGMG